MRHWLGLEEGEFYVADGGASAKAPDSGGLLARAEIATARQRERAAEEQERLARGGYLPRLSVLGTPPQIGSSSERFINATLKFIHVLCSVGNRAMITT